MVSFVVMCITLLNSDSLSLYLSKLFYIFCSIFFPLVFVLLALVVAVAVAASVSVRVRVRVCVSLCVCVCVIDRLEKQERTKK